jgi:adenosine deaminase
MNQIELIRALPKAELHVHIEGTFEPELMFAIAQRNQIQIPYQSVEEVKQAYNFHIFNHFLISIMLVRTCWCMNKTFMI